MRVGPSVIAAFAAISLSAGAAFAGDFGAMAFGDVPGKPYETTPEVGDHQESWARERVRANNPQDEAEHPPERRFAIEGPAAPVYERGSSAERLDRNWERFHEDVEAGRAAHASPWPIERGEEGRAARPWPGPRRAPRPAEPVEEAETASEADELRDAPAALGANPKAYSLWAGLSRPMMLPASSVQRVPAGDAREMGRLDYEEKILGLSADLNAEAIADPRDAAEVQRLVRPEGMLPVSIELDVSDSPGDIWPVVRRLPADLFKVDPKFDPQFYGARRARARVRGWVSTGGSARLLQADGVLRIEAARRKSPAASLGEEPESELLIGIRIPSETSPNAAVRETLKRLGVNTGFSFEKAIAYQRIPGSDQLAVVVSGRVPIAAIGRVMSDPAVVKVVPAPAKRNRRVSAPAKKVPPKTRLASFFTNEHPLLLPVVLLTTAFFLLPAWRGSRRRTRL
jgi:hypothetical protein